MLAKSLSALLLLLVLLWLLITTLILDAIMKLAWFAKQGRIANACIRIACKWLQAMFRLWGTRIVQQDLSLGSIRADRPILFIASHHSSLDIVLLTNHLQSICHGRHLGFISRPGLSKGVPAISENLRRNGFSLSKFMGKRNQQALAEFAQHADKHNRAIVIFPEGVKAVGCPEYAGEFERKGLEILLHNMPNAQVVPVAIYGSGQFYSTPRALADIWRYLPKFGQRIHLQVLPVIEKSNVTAMIDVAEQQLSQCYQQLKEQLAANDQTQLKFTATPAWIKKGAKLWIR